MNLLKLCNKTIEYAFYALFFLVPLVFYGTTSELFEFNKMWVTFAITIVITACWIIKMILTRQFFIRRTPFDIPLVLFLLSQILSTLLSWDPYVSWWGYYSRFNGGLLSTISYLLLYYALVSNVPGEENAENRSQPSRLLFFTIGLLLPVFSIILLPSYKDTTDFSNMILGTSLLGTLFFFTKALPGPFITRLIYIILASAGMAVAWGLPSHFGYDPTCYLFRGEMNVACWTDAFKPTIRLFSSMGQPAWLSAFLATVLPLCLGIFLKTKREAKLLLFILIGLFYLTLLYTNTRAGFLGFWIADTIFWSFILAKYIRSRSRFLTVFLLHFLVIAFAIATSRYLLFWFGGVIFYLSALTLLARRMFRPMLAIHGLLFLLTFFIATPFDEITSHFSPHIFTRPTAHTVAIKTVEETQPSNATITDSGNIRLHVWRGALAAWKDYPLFGTGVETFAFAYYRYKPAAHNTTSEWDYLYNKAHNEYLNYLATTGAFGLATYLFFLLVYTWKCMAPVFDLKKTETEEHLSDGVTAGLFAGWVAILVTNFFGFSVVIMNLFLFLLPGLTFIYTKKYNAYFRFPTQQPVKQTAGTLQLFAAFTAVALALLFLWNLLSFWYADKSYALGSNLMKSGDYQNGYVHILKAANTKPDEPTYKDELSFASAQIAAALQQQNQATQAAQLATQAISLNNEVLTQHPNNIVFWKTRIRILYLLSQLDKRYLPAALQAAQKAAEMAPNDAKVLYNLGVLYGQNSTYQKAEETLQKTIALRPQYTDASYALALFYHEQALGENKKVTDLNMQQKAVQTLEKLLTIDPNNQPAKKALSEWQK